MPSRAEMEADAERRIQAQIDRCRPSILPILYTLDPLEALALLGNLVDDTFRRFKPSSRLDLAEGWATTLLEGVREDLDKPRTARRD